MLNLMRVIRGERARMRVAYLLKATEGMTRLGGCRVRNYSRSMRGKVHGK